MTIDSFYYECSTGQQIVFGPDTMILPKMSELRDYIWKYSISGKNATFSREAKEKDVDVMIIGDDRQSIREKRDSIYEAFDRDVATGKHGKLYINGFYAPCYIIGAKNSDYVYNKKLKTKWSFLFLDTGWKQEQDFSFSAQSSADTHGDEWPDTWPHKWPKRAGGININIDNFIPCDFQLKAYGPATGVNITIGSNTYRVDKATPSGGYMIIDTRSTQPSDKRIYLVKSDGSEVNCFNDRYADASANSVFERLQTGVNAIEYSRAYGIDIKVFVERSEPKWS